MKFRVRHIMICTCAWGILSLMGCADDSADGNEQMNTHELRLSLGTYQYDVTRAAGDLPTGFVAYDHSDAVAKIMQIQGYMSYWNANGSGSWDAIPCTFTHTTYTISNTNVDIWTSRVSLKPLSTNSQNTDHKTYFLYGYMPKENVSSDVIIAPYGNQGSESYANGAVITFTGLKTVLAGDLCAIVGVQGYGNTITSASAIDMSLRLGKFNYNPDTEGNSIYLLIDHLYAGLKFSMALSEDYAKLRDIRVKKITLTPKVDDNSVIETVDAVVTIAANKNNQDQDPKSVVFKDPKTPVSGEVRATEVFNNEDGLRLETTPKEFMACVWPGIIIDGVKVANTKFTLETTYDVYDRKGNLIRKDEKAQNTISMEYNYLEAGKLHVVNIKVMPTYLYVLSDPDLDDPTFHVE